MLQLTGISHTYGATRALTACTLTVAAGARVAIIGPSGCGKSTLLRVIVGLEAGHTGTVTYRGRDITTFPTHQRGIGLMFQDHALFPHMTVAANIAYGLRGKPAAVATARVAALADMLGIGGLLQRLPDQLSGGERQRVALARSIAPSPGLLLLDEPFASLDRALRDRFVAELPPLLQRENVSAIYVTHDPSDASRIADQLVVMRAGQIVRHDTPHAVVHDPQTSFVADLLGLRARIPCSVDAQGCATAYGRFPLTRPAATELVIRPEAAIDATQHAHTVIEATVVAVWHAALLPQLTVTAADGSAAIVLDWPFAEVPVVGSVCRIALRHDCLALVRVDH